MTQPDYENAVLQFILPSIICELVSVVSYCSFFFFLASQKQVSVMLLTDIQCVNQFMFLTRFLNPLTSVRCLSSLYRCTGSVSVFFVCFFFSPAWAAELKKKPFTGVLLESGREFTQQHLQDGLCLRALPVAVGKRFSRPLLIKTSPGSQLDTNHELARQNHTRVRALLLLQPSPWDTTGNQRRRGVSR